MYKHELGIYKDRFQRLAGQVLVFPTDINLKNLELGIFLQMLWKQPINSFQL